MDMENQILKNKEKFLEILTKPINQLTDKDLDFIGFPKEILQNESICDYLLDSKKNRPSLYKKLVTLVTRLFLEDFIDEGRSYHSELPSKNLWLQWLRIWLPKLPKLPKLPVTMKDDIYYYNIIINNEVTNIHITILNHFFVYISSNIGDFLFDDTTQKLWQMFIINNIEYDVCNAKNILYIELLYPNLAFNSGKTAFSRLINGRTENKTQIQQGLLHLNYIKKNKENGTTGITRLGVEQIIKGLDQSLSYYKTLSINEAKVNTFNEFVDEMERYFQDNTHIYLQKAVNIDFKAIVGFNQELANFILSKPEDALELIKVAYNNQNIEYNKRKTEPIIKIYNLPESETYKIGELRTKCVGRMVRIPAVILACGLMYGKEEQIVYKCPSCDNEITISQNKMFLQKPRRCSCSHSGTFNKVNAVTIQKQIIKCEEMQEQIEERSHQQSINVMLKDELTDIQYQSKYEQTLPVIINGIVKKKVVYKNNRETPKHSIYIDALSVEFSNDNFSIDISKDEQKEFIELARKYDKRMIDYIIHKFAPKIYGRDKVKKSLIYSMVSGGNKKKIMYKGKMESFRDDSHIMLIGDPSTAKSYLLRKARELYPLSRWISGKGTTSVGLLGATIKDEDFGGWVFQKGVLPMANNHVCICDEIDKMPREDTDALHEALENQTCTIHKSKIHTEIETDLTFMCGCNPKYSRFDDSTEIFSQIIFPVSLLSRFDLIHVLRDLPDKKTDKMIAEGIFDIHMNTQKNDALDDDNIDWDEEKLKRFIYFVRHNFNPKVTIQTKNILLDFYKEQRAKMGEIDGIKNVNITPRHLEGLIRITKASAKLRCKNLTDIFDAKESIELFLSSMDSLGLINDDGLIDIDVLYGGDSLGNKIKMKDILNILIKNNKPLHFDELDILLDFDLNYDLIDKMKKNGDIIESSKDRYIINNG